MTTGTLYNIYMYIYYDHQECHVGMSTQVQQAGISLPDPDYYKRNESDKVYCTYLEIN